MEIIKAIIGVFQMLWIIFKGFWIDLSTSIFDFQSNIKIAAAIIIGIFTLPKLLKKWFS